jgi:hypothetical protein
MVMIHPARQVALDAGQLREARGCEICERISGVPGLRVRSG